MTVPAEHVQRQRAEATVACPGLCGAQQCASGAPALRRLPSPPGCRRGRGARAKNSRVVLRRARSRPGVRRPRRSAASSRRPTTRRNRASVRVSPSTSSSGVRHAGGPNAASRAAVSSTNARSVPRADLTRTGACVRTRRLALPFAIVLPLPLLFPCIIVVSDGTDETRAPRRRHDGRRRRESDCQRISFSSSSGAMSASRRFMRSDARAPGDDQSFFSSSDTRAGRWVNGATCRSWAETPHTSASQPRRTGSSAAARESAPSSEARPTSYRACCRATRRRENGLIDSSTDRCASTWSGPFCASSSSTKIADSFQ